MPATPFAQIRAKQIAGITYKPDSRAQCEKSRCHSDGRKTQLHLYGSMISGGCQYSSCMGGKHEFDQRERFHEKSCGFSREWKNVGLASVGNKAPQQNSRML